jgi:hypothetical protein
MCKWISRGRNADEVERDLARAKSLLIGLRAKIDNEDSRKAQAYGHALRRVAGLLSGSLNIAAPDAMLARALSAKDLDHASGDLQRSAARCRTFLNAPSPASEIAESIAVACSILAELYRMRFHALKAAQPQKAEASEQAERLAQLIKSLACTEKRGKLSGKHGQMAA